jgi:dihydroorotate dehydrogenase
LAAQPKAGVAAAAVMAAAGSVTPHPQPGNAKPRVFRLPEAQAVINRYVERTFSVHVDCLQLCKYKYVAFDWVMLLQAACCEHLLP